MKHERRSSGGLKSEVLYDGLVASLHERFGADEKDEEGWREKEALRMLPLHREIARIVQWEDSPLPSDAELLGREILRLRRFDSWREYRATYAGPAPKIEISVDETFETQ